MGYVGHLLILMAGTGLGVYCARHLHRRTQSLQQTGGVLQALLRQMTYTARPMSELWRQLAQNEAYSGFSLVQDTAAGLADAPFGVAFAAAVERAAEAGFLQPPGRQLLLEFGEGCGRYDLARQEQHIRHYCDRLAELEEEARRQAAVKGRICPVMGLAGGAALALLLL